MQVRTLALAALAAAAAAPCPAQIIATSLLDPDTTGGTGSTGGRRFAVHLMASPFAKWKINSYLEEPRGAHPEDLAFQQAATTDAASRFLIAGEAAFKAGTNTTVGLGGWYNDVGSADVDFFQLTPFDEVFALAGVAPYELRVWEVHGNAFYKDLGVQVGLVQTRWKQTGLRANTRRIRFDSRLGDFVEEFLPADVAIDRDTESFNSWDAFLVYKHASSAVIRLPWSVSLGSGAFRDGETKTTAFSGFATASVQVYKGLGIDASAWYVGGKKPSPGRAQFADLLGNAVSDNLSRFTIGIGYTFN